jgi:hypothetical protein
MAARALKVVFLGGSGTGKTSIVAPCTDKVISGNLAPTVGGACRSLPHRLRDCALGLAVWGTAAQEIYRSLPDLPPRLGGGGRRLRHRRARPSRTCPRASARCRRGRERRHGHLREPDRRPGDRRCSRGRCAPPTSRRRRPLRRGCAGRSSSGPRGRRRELSLRPIRGCVQAFVPAF